MANGEDDGDDVRRGEDGPVPAGWLSDGEGRVCGEEQAGLADDSAARAPPPLRLARCRRRVNIGGLWVHAYALRRVAGALPPLKLAAGTIVSGKAARRQRRKRQLELNAGDGPADAAAAADGGARGGSGRGARGGRGMVGKPGGRQGRASAGDAAECAAAVVVAEDAAAAACTTAAKIEPPAAEVPAPHPPPPPQLAQ